MKRNIALILLLISLTLAVPAPAETAAPAGGAANTAASAYTPEELLTQWYQLGDLLRANGYYPFVTLGKGDVGYEVTALQTRLAQLGYYQKEIVENYGNGTYNAMRAFEKANGLTADGEASAEDQKLLYGSAAVAYAGVSDATSGATASKP
jgi:peptidoglycan hydrolase-like protein with peptidoglycan-binding domain